MTELNIYLNEYLQLRRTLGYKLKYPGMILPQFISYLETAGTEIITTELAISWARLRHNVQPILLAKRLGAVRGFAKYMQAIDKTHEVPPRDVFGASQQRPVPYLWSNADIKRLMQGTEKIKPVMLGVSCKTLFGLLSASGMRIGEALSLELDDVNLINNVITIREGKFGRPRLVPLHESTANALEFYSTLCEDFRSRPRPFFISQSGSRLRYPVVRNHFNQITASLGLRTIDVHPRIHDLRHTFAMASLISWLRSGADVNALMPVLSTYLGHVSPASTWWYLQASPKLMELGAAKLDISYGGEK